MWFLLEHCAYLPLAFQSMYSLIHSLQINILIWILGCWLHFSPYMYSVKLGLQNTILVMEVWTVLFYPNYDGFMLYLVSLFARKHIYISLWLNASTLWLVHALPAMLFAHISICISLWLNASCIRLWLNASYLWLLHALPDLSLLLIHICISLWA